MIRGEHHEGEVARDRPQGLRGLRRDAMSVMPFRLSVAAVVK